MTRQTVSIIVNNFNYGRYVGEAIESALAQTYSPVEVIVVDDGSTDSSADVIRAFGERVTAVFQPNGGQAAAMNRGFESSAGDPVLFLDADDLLHPDAVAAVVAASTPGVAKVQFRLSEIDGDGVRFGVDPPIDVPMPNGDVVPELLATGSYVTPVTSGNAYSRAVLDHLMPIPAASFRLSADGYLNCLAPFHGPIASLDDELGSYRHHGANRWAYGDAVTIEQVRSRLEHDLVKERFIENAARAAGRTIEGSVSLRAYAHVLERLASLRVDPDHHPVVDDTPLMLLRAGLPAVRRSSELRGPAERAFYAATLVSIAALPRRVAWPVATVALGGRRPPWLRAAARRLRRIGSPHRRRG